MEENKQEQVLLGVTGSGKTFAMANQLTGKGQIVIDYFSNEDFNRIFELLSEIESEKRILKSNIPIISQT